MLSDFVPWAWINYFNQDKTKFWRGHGLISLPYPVYIWPGDPLRWEHPILSVGGSSVDKTKTWGMPASKRRPAPCGVPPDCYNEEPGPEAPMGEDHKISCSLLKVKSRSSECSQLFLTKYICTSLSLSLYIYIYTPNYMCVWASQVTLEVKSLPANAET